VGCELNWASCGGKRWEGTRRADEAVLYGDRSEKVSRCLLFLVAAVIISFLTSRTSVGFEVPD
jgi:ABC-type uncharacterized transport system permease subunit